MLPSFSYLSRSALTDFTNIVTRIFAVLKKLTCIAYCAVEVPFPIIPVMLCKHFNDHLKKTRPETKNFLYREQWQSWQCGRFTFS